MLRAVVHLPEIDSASAGTVLANVLDALAWASAVWFQDNLDLAEACCEGITYREPAMSSRPVYRSVAEMVNHPDQGYSCAELVYFDLGLHRAHGGNGTIVLIENEPYEWHVVWDQNGTRRDPTKEILEGGCICRAK